MRHFLVALLSALLISGCGGSTTKPESSVGSTQSTTTLPETAEALPCPTYKASVTTGTVTDKELNELSGLIKSAGNQNVFWTHNDSGDDARVFAISPEGKRLATFELRDASSADFEDIAMQYGEQNEVWVADIGDNFRFRSSVQLYHFAEPEVPTEGVSEGSVNVKRVNVRYQNPNGEGTVQVDSEAFFVDRAGNGYLVEKTHNQKNAWVFRILAEDLKASSATARPIAQITGNSSGTGYGPTAADLSADGTTLAIKNYTETFVWKFTETSSIAAVLKAQPTSPCTAKTGRGEAIAFDGADLFTVEEGVNKPLRKTQAQ